jgi:hypothetical protein
MERIMLESCKWLLNPPTVLSFGHRLVELVSSTDRRYPLETLLELTNMQVEPALYDYVLCSAVPPSLVAISAVMNAIEGMEISSEKEQRLMLNELCSTLKISNNDEYDMDLIQRIQIRLYEGLTGTYDTDIHHSSSIDTRIYVSSKHNGVPTIHRPTSPKSVVVSAAETEENRTPPHRFSRHRFHDEMIL